MSRKLPPETVEKFKELRAKGYSYVKIAEACGVWPETVRYYLSEKARAKVLERRRRWYLKNKEIALKRHKEWRQKNPEQYRRSITLSLLKHCIERNILSKQEVIEFLNGIETKC